MRLISHQRRVDQVIQLHPEKVRVNQQNNLFKKGIPGHYGPGKAGCFICLDQHLAGVRGKRLRVDAGIDFKRLIMGREAKVSKAS